MVDGVAEGVFTTRAGLTITVRGEAVALVTGEDALSVTMAQ